MKFHNLLQHTILNNVIILIYDGLLHPRSQKLLRLYVWRMQKILKIKVLWKSRITEYTIYSGFRKFLFTYIDRVHKSIFCSCQVCNADHMRCCDSYDASYTRVKRLYEPSKSTCDNRVCCEKLSSNMCRTTI